MVDYLLQILLPVGREFTLFHDDYPITSEFFQPGRHWFSVLLIAVLLGTAIFLRVILPVFSLAVIWFFSGHLLESTVIGLELYFEHRNYLPMYGVILFVAYCIISLFKIAQLRYVMAAAVVWVASTTITTASVLELWKNPYLQGKEWYQNHPDSRRALDHYWNMSLVYSDHQQRSLYKTFRNKYPDDLYPVIKQILHTACYLDQSVTIDQRFWQQARMLAGKTNAGRFVSNIRI